MGTQKALAVLLVVALAAPVLAQVTTRPVALPGGLVGATAQWVDGQALLFGGLRLEDAQVQDRILRYQPATDTFTPAGTVLPSPRAYMASVWTGQHVFLFGGQTGINQTTSQPIMTPQVVRYTPATGTLAVMGASLPQPRQGVAAAWDGTHAYLFGGVGCADPCPILRYHPASDTMTQLSVALDSPLSDAAAVWNGTHALLFGGRIFQTDDIRDTVWAFHPSGSLAALPDRLDVPRYASSAVWAGDHALLFGGATLGHQRIDGIVRHAGNDTLVASLPQRSVHTAAAWTGSAAFIFGGAIGQAVYCYLCSGPTTSSTTGATSTTTTEGAVNATPERPEANESVDPGDPVQPNSTTEPALCDRILGVVAEEAEGVAVWWVANPACPPERYLVWEGAGTRLLALTQATNTTLAHPGPGLHTYYVQGLLAGEADLFGAAPAYASNTLAIGERAQFLFDPILPDPTPAASEPAGQASGLWALAALAALGVLLLALVFLRRRR